MNQIRVFSNPQYQAVYEQIVKLDREEEKRMTKRFREDIKRINKESKIQQKEVDKTTKKSIGSVLKWKNYKQTKKVNHR